MHPIKHVAIMGAGVMGTQIALCMARLGFECLLYDLPAGPEDRSFLARSVLMANGAQDDIRACNTEDDLRELASCELVIEAIVDNLDWKVALYEKMVPHMAPHAILTSNTLGWSIERLASYLPLALQSRFLGLHFFAPTTTTPWVELIPHSKTSPEVLACMRQWLGEQCRQPPLVVKDAPHFLAHRIGMFALLAGLWHAERFRVSPEAMDAYLGSFIQRPGKGIFQALDALGLDVFESMVSIFAKMAHDPWQAFYRLPLWILELIERGALGQKTQRGIYLKQDGTLLVFYPPNHQYRPLHPRFQPALPALEGMDFPSWLALIRSKVPDVREAKWMLSYLADVFLYCIHMNEEVAHHPHDIDVALKKGWGWGQGPIEHMASLDPQVLTAWLEEACQSGELLFQGEWKHEHQLLQNMLHRIA